MDRAKGADRRWRKRGGAAGASLTAPRRRAASAAAGGGVGRRVGCGERDPRLAPRLRGVETVPFRCFGYRV